MTVPSTTRRAGPFLGNGSTTTFAFPFKVFAASDLAVYRVSTAGVETLLTLTTDYSVTLNPDQDASPGGSVTPVVLLASGEKLTVIGATQYTQELDLPAGGNFNAKALEDALDRTTFQIQQLAEAALRALALPPSAAASGVLPSPVAGNVIGWDDTASALRNIDPVTLASIVAYSNRRVLVANGGLASYTLAADPGNANNCLVAVGGVVQTPGVDYTVSGVTLTPTTLWPVGTGNVTVVYGEALPVGTVNAADVAYTALLTGAVSRSLRAARQESISIEDFGASTSLADNSSALQLAVSAALLTGKALRIPANAGEYVFASTITIPYDATQTAALRILGDSDINYYSTQSGSRLRYTGNSYAFDVQGRGIDVAGANSGSPVGVTFERISLTGTASALGAIRYRRAWYGAVRRCGFWSFGNASGGVVTIDSSSGGGGRNGFAGEITVERNWFASSGRCIWLTGDTGGVVNVVRVRDNVALDQQYFLIHSFGAFVPYSINVQVTGNHIEGTTVTDIFSQAVAGNWLIQGNYIEQNNAAQNSPRIDIQGTNNIGITICDNTFSKQLQAAGQTLACVANAKGVIFTGNLSNYGGSSDRWSIDLQTCTQVTAEPTSVVSGTAYPVLMNNVALSSGRSAETWRQVAAGGTGGFVGISSGDGWPGGTVCTTLNEVNKTNGMVTVSVKSTVTTKSASGTSLLIGLLPFANNGGDVVFPILAQNITGTKPLWGRIAAGGNFATVVDANNTAINYQTAISVGSIIEAQFSYLTQA